MKKVLVGVLGAAAGTVLLGVGGYLYGLLFLVWFGPRSCCGLEGLLPPIVGSVTGATLGLTVGAMTAILVGRGSPLRLLRLVMFLSAGGALTWLLSLVLGPFDIERIPGIVFFLAVAFLIPLIAWMSLTWEKPETSI